MPPQSSATPQDPVPNVIAQPYGAYTQSPTIVPGYGNSKPSPALKISTVSNFRYGYRNLEDITNLPPGVLVTGSQNVLHNWSDRIQVRQGYVLDGAASTDNAGIKSSWFFQNQQQNFTVVLRCGKNTTGSNGTIAFRYKNSIGTVTWVDLITGISSANMLFRGARWFNKNEGVNEALLVNGDGNIYEWNPAIATVQSSTSTTVTISGSKTWASLGFYETTSPRAITINGISYTYTGGESTLTLTGLSGVTANAGDLIYQTPITMAWSSVTDSVATPPNLIATLYNQAYYASTTSNCWQLSNVYDFTSCAQGHTPRAPGEGNTSFLDAPIIGFYPQEGYMYIFAGNNFIYNISFSDSSFVPANSVTAQYTEQVVTNQLISVPQQAPVTQECIGKVRNMIAIVTQFPTLDFVGRIEDILGTPQSLNISDPIRLDFDTYKNFTGSQVILWKQYFFISLPAYNITRIYNLTTQAWEAPQTAPWGGFWIDTNGDLYAHDFTTSQSYKLFTGYTDNGAPIDAIATFSFMSYGARMEKKQTMRFWMDGYVNQNTTLTGSLQFELDGCSTTLPFTISGSDKQIVCLPSDNVSLGKTPLGKHGLGTNNLQASSNSLPPYFKVIKTFTKQHFYQVQLSFSIYGVDQRFELISFGLDATMSPNLPIEITE